MGIEYLEAGPERVVAKMPVKGNTQPYGLLHGGASCVLAETLGSVGAALHAGAGRIAMGIEINATHHRSATEGYVTGVATRLARRTHPRHRTRSSSPTTRTGGSAPRASPVSSGTSRPNETFPSRCAGYDPSFAHVPLISVPWTPREPGPTE